MKIGITERGDAGLNQVWRNNDCDGIILITKAPQLLTDIPNNAIVHCTITGHGSTVLEPGVAAPEVTLRAYHDIVKEIGPERTVLRIDPIIITGKGIAKAVEIVKHARSRVRISFIDNYAHVAARFKAAGLPSLRTNGLHYDLAERREAASKFPNAEICGEPGFECTGCVSDRDFKALNLNMENNHRAAQRPSCNCLGVKIELLSNKGQCPHGCLYCYWK